MTAVPRGTVDGPPGTTSAASRQRRPLGELVAQDLMTPHVLALDVTASVDQALALMREHRVRHLPVLQAGRCTGLVDDRLLALGHLTDVSPRSRLVSDVMTHYVPRVTAEADLPRVARLLTASGCDAVVVVDGSTLLGIITAVDVVEAVGASSTG